MDYFPKLLTIILTLFFLMICGYVCRKKGIIDTKASKALSQLIISVGQPMMIINALNRADFSQANLNIAWKVVVISFAMHVLMALMAFGICRLLKKNPDEIKIFEFSLVFANAGFIGFPILDSILGVGIGSFMGAFYVISFHLFLWTWGIMILARGRSDIRLTPKKIFLNYGTVPCAIGIALFFLKALVDLPPEAGAVAATQPLITLPEALAPLINGIGDFFYYLGSLCTPISVLVTGALLATVSLPKMFTSGRMYLHSAIKLLLFPVIICLLAKLCGLEDPYILMATAMAGVPSAATITMLAELYDIAPGYASQSVGMTSILSTATLPMVMLFAQWVIGL